LLRARITAPGYNEQRKFFVSTTFANSPDTFRMKIRIQSLVAVTFVHVTFALQPMTTAPLELKNFNGGMTDFYLGAAGNKHD